MNVNITTVETGNSRLEVNLPAIQRGDADKEIPLRKIYAITDTILGTVRTLEAGQAIVIWLEEE